MPAEPPPTIQQGNQHANNFDVLRLLGAFFVLVSHSFGILNKGLEQPGIRVSGYFIIPSEIGLYIFFTISGYLVTQSLLQSKSYGHYLWKRFLRIVPALVVVNFVCVIMGAFVGTLPLGEYFTQKETWGYFFKNSTLIVNQFTLPGVFKTLDDQSVNASLWTILIEVKFYLLLMLAGAATLLNRKWLLLALFLVFEAIGIWMKANSLSIKGFDTDSYVNFGTYFYIGTLLYVFRKEIIFHWLVAGSLLLIAFFTRHSLVFPFFLSVFLGYVVIGFGKSRAIISLKGFDFSYGLYLYAFPVQQVILLYAGYHFPVGLHILLSTIIALMFGIASWFAIEKPALKKKKWLEKS